MPFTPPSPDTLIEEKPRFVPPSPDSLLSSQDESFDFKPTTTMAQLPRALFGMGDETKANADVLTSRRKELGDAQVEKLRQQIKDKYDYARSAISPWSETGASRLAKINASEAQELKDIGIQPIGLDEGVHLPRLSKNEQETLFGTGPGAEFAGGLQRGSAALGEALADPVALGAMKIPAVGAALAPLFLGQMGGTAVAKAGEAAGALSAGDVNTAAGAAAESLVNAAPLALAGLAHEPSAGESLARALDRTEPMVPLPQEPPKNILRMRPSISPNALELPEAQPVVEEGIALPQLTDLSPADQLRAIRLRMGQQNPLSPTLLKEEPLGGQVSFNAPAESRAVPNIRQSVANQIRRDVEEPVQREGVTGPDAPAYRRPTEPISAEQAARQKRRSDLESGMTGPSGETYDVAPTEPVNPAPGPIPEGQPLSKLQRARLQKAIARGADIQTLKNILRLPDEESTLLTVQQASQGETGLAGDTIVKPKGKPNPISSPEERPAFDPEGRPFYSDADWAKYQELNAKRADKSVPGADRMAAWGEFEKLKNTYQGKTPAQTAVAPTGAAAIVSKLESLKARTSEGGHMQAFGVVPAIWNTALDIAIAAVKAGKSAKDAIEDALKHIRYNAPKGYDEAAIRSHIAGILAGPSGGSVPAPAASTAVPATVPAVPATATPATTLPTGTPAATTGTTPPATASLNRVYQIFKPGPKMGTTLGQKVSGIIEAVRTGVSSKFRPIDKLAEDIAKAYGVNTPKGIAGIMEQLKGSQGKGEADIYRFDRDVSSLVKGDELDFNAYMFLRRGMDRLAQDAATGQARRKVANFTEPELQSNLAALEAKLGPDKLANFQQAADRYQAHLDDALRLQVESGRMSAQTYQDIKDGNQFYAPFKVMKYLEATMRPQGSGARVDTPADYTKAMVGIEDPNFKLGDILAAGRQNLLLSRILADKNNAMRQVGALDQFDTAHQFIWKLPPKTAPPRGWEAVNVFENGQQIRYAVRPEVSEALAVNGSAGKDVMSRTLGLMSVPFKSGATALNIPFQVSNLLADVPRQALVSKYGIRTVSDMVQYPLDFTHALLSSLSGDLFGKDSKLFLDFLDSGVAGGTVAEALTPEALKFQEPTAVSKSTALAKTVLMTLPNFAKAIEQTSKVLGVKLAMREHGVGTGKDLAQQFPEAITELRRFSGSPDFGRQGKWVQQANLNLLYMFLNARIQGAIADVGRLAGRDGGKQAGATWLKTSMAVGIPTAILWALNHRDESVKDYESRPQQEKQNYWLIPKDSYITNEQGERMRDYWRIPKREIGKWIANLTESSLNFAKERDPQGAARFAQSMIEDLSPVNIQGNTAQERLESIGSGLNPLIKTPLEVATGRDLYRHKNIVPDAMAKASPEQQYTDRTPEAFKKLAALMPGVHPEFIHSPLIMENMVKNLTAGLVTQFLPRPPVQGRGDIENAALLQRFQAMPFTDQEKFKTEMQALERQAADEQLGRHRIATKLLSDNKGIPLDQIIERAGKDPKLIQPMQDPRLIHHIVDLWVATENGATSQDKQLLALPARQRAAYIANKLTGLDDAHKEALFQDMARKRILTKSVAEELPNYLTPPSPTR